MVVKDLAEVDVDTIEVGTICYCIKSREYYALISIDHIPVKFRPGTAKGWTKLLNIHNHKCKVCGVTCEIDPDVKLQSIEINPKNSISPEIKRIMEFHNAPPRKEFVYICKRCRDHILHQWKDSSWHS